ncbi:MAG: type III-A CRISPR-associated protein Csm2 [Firmicutes bacterium]|nr:type III-A CRISPR-associated protein Csm2 [Bacillota bacterium]
MPLIIWEDKSKNRLKEDLFSTGAEQWAKKVYKSGLQKDKLEKNKQAQIRKFYDEILYYKELVNTADDKARKEEKFKQYLPFILMLRAKCAYSLGRKLITPEFKEFLDECLNSIKDFNDFVSIASFFEAFMGFYKYFEKTGKIE